MTSTEVLDLSNLSERDCLISQWINVEMMDIEDVLIRLEEYDEERQMLMECDKMAGLVDPGYFI